jgi:phosphoribosylglycinamide formyltransferase-1
MLYLCSGGGDLRFIHRSIQNGWLSRWIDISVIADRNCPAADYAKQFSFKTKYMDFSDAGQISLIDAIMSLQPDVTITTVHRILRPPVFMPNLLQAFGRICWWHSQRFWIDRWPA